MNQYDKLCLLFAHCIPGGSRNTASQGIPHQATASPDVYVLCRHDIVAHLWLPLSHTRHPIAWSQGASAPPLQRPDASPGGRGLVPRDRRRVAHGPPGGHPPLSPRSPSDILNSLLYGCQRILLLGAAVLILAALPATARSRAGTVLDIHNPLSSVGGGAGGIFFHPAYPS